MSSAANKEKRYKWRREDYRENTKGLLMVNTGNGKGKTTAALGLLMRAAGRGLKCCLIQFMKSKNDRYGEHEAADKLGIEVHTMGDGFTWDTKDPAQDIKTSEETWALCVEKMRSAEYELLVFDELVYVLDYKLLDVDKVLEEIKEVRAAQPHLHIVLTGRNAPPELVEAADLVTEMTEIKHPFNAGIFAQQGIEF
ncbi:MAG TPA: cob(I)yrinic acid a,c-diamide adenosyltransferase [Pyrinomonadaceae bacterium]|jgi:cob(I)alamin adenosyltransferase|nr:cob(I)yrinic acid a,c-diamide adenosyltransferase [Pyrinomonadaceae bacterium]